MVNYHNLTPPELFAPWDNGLARHQVRARSELARLARRACLGVAVSEVNRADLVRQGFAATAVVPTGGRSCQPTAAQCPADAPRPAGARWLSVGRLAPNKAVEDAVAALFAYRCRIDPRAELVVVGKPALPVYSTALRRYAAELGLADAVHFRGRVDDQALADAYAEADVLVVTSEHEGFCVPVVEAMAHGLPVVAYRRGALGEVLGEGRRPAREQGPPHPGRRRCTAVSRPPACERRLVAAGHDRLAALHLDEAGPRLADLLEAAWRGGPWPAGVAPTGAAAR